MLLLLTAFFFNEHQPFVNGGGAIDKISNKK
jgi:hypothetical protein